MPLASIDVWFSEHDDRSCRILVFEGACEIELSAHGQRLLSYRCPSVAAALNQANQWKPLDQLSPQAAA
jgi:hypothetical protein